MKCLDVDGKKVAAGLLVADKPYPHVVLGDGGNKRSTWIAIGKRDAEKMVRPRRVPCPDRDQNDSHFGEEVPADKQTPHVCQKCGETFDDWSFKPTFGDGKYWTRKHAASGEVNGPVVVGDAGIIALKDSASGQPTGRYLIVAPRPGDDNRVLVLWRVTSGYRGSASITPGEGVVAIASDAAWHSGRGNMGETAEIMAILKPCQELRAKISGRNVQNTRARLQWDGKNISVDFGGEELFAATSEKVEGDYI